MNLSKLTVRGQLTLGFGILATGLAVMAGLGSYEVHEANARYQNHISQVSKIELAANDMIDAVNARAIAIRDMAIQHDDAASVTRLSERVKEQDAKIDRSLASLKDRLSQVDNVQPALLAEAKKVEATEAIYRPVAQSIVANLLAGEHELAGQRIKTECSPALAKLVGELGTFLGESGQVAVKTAKAGQDEYETALTLMLALAGLSIVLGVVAATLITRSLGRALGAEPNRLSELVQNVASGDLRAIDGAQSAPAGSVLASMGAMQQSLVSLIGQVRHSADSIVVASAEIASGNQDLSQRTENTASSLQHTAASMHQMTSTVAQNADSAQQASQLANSAAEVAARGGQVVDRVVQTMQDISASSQKINDIIGVIDGIAFQTNILALNAAVEAARAGEQGRGFAVVAGEVRNLAQRSAGAAKEIKGLISSSVETVAGGSRLVGEAGETMRDIVNQVRRVTDLIAEINAATSEQTSGINQVSNAITQLDQGTQQNAALVEEIAAAAESLRQQSQTMLGAVSVFRLSHGDQAGAAIQQARVSSSPTPAPAAHRPAPASRAAKHSVAVCTPGTLTMPAARVAVTTAGLKLGDSTSCPPAAATSATEATSSTVPAPTTRRSPMRWASRAMLSSGWGEFSGTSSTRHPASNRTSATPSTSCGVMPRRMATSGSSASAAS
ncbi:methyl-accepting chemotaxis protein [Comamonadaceae bacterium SL12-8]|uniref:Methyl-accepting chemotaxis protein n=1 Tax=Amphibiibacter pelophylacis TaxID=1799477 RepID=A0ACC6NZX1_9BURK